MKRFKVQQACLVFMMLILGVFLITGCSGSDDQNVQGSSAKKLVSIEVTPATASIPNGAPQQFMAIAVYDDGTSTDVTASATWTSDATGVATVNSTSGLATGLSVGTGTITAAFGGKSGSETLTVTAATLSSIVVTPAIASIPMDLTQRFVAVGAYSDGTSHDISNVVTWTSSAAGVATVVSPGIVTGRSTGTAAITATLGGKSGSAPLTILPASVTLSSIVVAPLTASIPMGVTQRFVATAVYSNGYSYDVSNASQLIWTSSATGVATVVSPGIATGRSVGTATITATLNCGTCETIKSGSATLTVTAAKLMSIAVTPKTTTIAIRSTQPFVAIATYSDASVVDVTALATWISGATGVATVISTTGVATGRSGGTATITATFGGQSDSGILTVTAATLMSIAVTPPTASVAIGSTQPFVAIAHYSDGSNVNITALPNIWTSGAIGVATVISNSGVAIGVDGGIATITATYGGKTGSGNLTVVPASATVLTIAVTPATASVAIGSTKPFVAIAHYSDGSYVNITALPMIWTSGAIGVATVISNTGVAIGVSGGTAQIIATYGGKTGSGTLTVIAPVGPPVVNLGLAGNFAALSKAAITDVPTSIITGDIGASPITGAAIGVTCPEVTGNIYSVDAAGPAPCTVIDPVMLTTAVSNMEAAYTDAATRTPGVGPNLNLGGGTVSGQTLTPGTYTWGTNVTITTNLILNGGPTDVWIFQISGTLDMSPNMSVLLSGGALPENIFWQVAGVVTLGTNSHFEGIILAQTMIAMKTGASINGRLLAQTQITLQSNTVTEP